jgi:hypothetical protein
MAIKFYQVIAASPDGEPHGWDLFVRADDPHSAIVHWQIYYETANNPERVDEIPDTPKEGVIRWESIACVYERNGNGGKS